VSHRDHDDDGGFRMSGVVPVVSAMLAGVLSWAAWRWSAVPFAWAGFAWAAVAALWAILARRRWARLVLVNLALLFAVVASAELVLRSQAGRRGGGERRLETSHDVVAADPVFGWAPYGPTVRHARLTVDGREVYDVDYTFDADGRRVTPPDRPRPPVGTVVAFGGSFTFGEGVADAETMPWRVEELTDGRWRVANLGFQGWGPQQMLAALDAGLLADVATGDRVEAVYQCAFFHVERAAGRVRWAGGTPRYVLDGDGVRRAGFYQDDLEGPYAWPAVLDRWLAWRGLAGSVRPPGRSAVALFAGIVATARDRVLAHGPGARFHVLYWDDEPPWLDGPVVDALRSAHVGVTRVSGILPVRDAAMRLDPADAHPSAAAHDRVARWIVTHRLDRSGG
jgi:hypothetical protein